MNVVDTVRLDGTGFEVPETASAFVDALPRPTIFFVPGLNPDVERIVAGSLHGNEPSGLRAIHRFLYEVVHRGRRPATNLWFFLGGIEAAKAAPSGLRMLPGRRDLNRCFRAPFDGVDGAVAEAVLKILRPLNPELVVDLHNNTGHNPAYTVTPALEPEHLWLGRLFATRFVHSTLKLGTFSEAFEDLAPSITVECGMAGRPEADATAFAGLCRLMEAPQVEHAFVSPEPLQVLVDSVRVSLASGLSLAFAGQRQPHVHLTLDAEIDRHNFEFLPEGAPLGWVPPGGSWPLVALDESGVDRSAELFHVEGDRLLVRRSFIPIMMTTDRAVALSDCLFYATARRE